MRNWMTRAELATAAAIVLSVVAGCMTTHEPRIASTAALPGTPACFLRRNFRGSWTVLNTSTLIVYTLPSTRGAYLIRLQQPAVGLNFNTRLGLSDVQRTPRICGNRTAFLLVPGNTPPRILITDVRRLTDSERNQLLAQAGQPSLHRDASNPGAEPR